MPTLSLSRLYSTGEVLFKSHLDTPFTEITTFLNTTGVDSTNIQDSAITSAKLQANSVDVDKLDELGDYQMNTLKIGSTGVTLSKGALNELSADGHVIVDGDIILGEDGHTITDSSSFLTFQQPIRITDSGGSSYLRKVSSNELSIESRGLDLNGGTRILSDDGKILQMRDSSDTYYGNVLIGDPNNTNEAYRIISGTKTGSGNTVTVDFTTEGFSDFTSTPVVLTSYTSNSTGGTYGPTLTSRDEEGFVCSTVGLSGATINWIAIGRYA